GRVSAGTGVGQDQACDPLGCPAPELERHVPAHRQTADDDPIKTRGVHRVQAPARALIHREHATLRRGTPAEPRQVGGDDVAPVHLGAPHPSIQRERVDQQEAVGHRTAFAFGPTITGSAPGRISNTAGAGPTRSPSAYTMTRRSASIRTRVARAMRTAGCETWVPP